MSSARRRLPFGAELLDGKRTRFRLWAPDAQRVELLRADNATIAMTAADDGWFETTCSAPAGTRYRYRIDDRLEVPDPASRAQDGGIDGPSIVVDAAAYAWQQPQWRGRRWQDAIIYEMHVGLYGGFAGVAAELEDLAALGITAIELMPVAQFPGERNWGYDGVLPFAPAASYGTPEQLKALIDAAHALGLMVLLDVVYNHFGPEGNYLAQYAQDFFDPSRQTPWGAAIDFKRPQVREFFLENALYWLHEYRFDGLRIDAVHAIGDADFMHELIERAGQDHAGNCRHHLVFENDDNDAGLLAEGCTAQWNDDAHHVLHVLLTGERAGYYADYVEHPAAALARWLAEGFVYQGQPMAHRQGRPRGTPSGSLAPIAFVNALQNHDQIGNRAFGDRLIAQADPQALSAAYALLLLIPQIPMLFMGEDWGSARPFRYFTDYRGELADAVREGRRREFAQFDAFAATDLPDPNALRTFEASKPDLDARDNAFRAHIRQLLALRHDAIIPRLAGTHSLGATELGEAAVDARWRMGDGSILRVAVNLGSTALDIDTEAGTLLHASCARAQAGDLPAAACIVWLQAASP